MVQQERVSEVPLKREGKGLEVLFLLPLLLSLKTAKRDVEGFSFFLKREGKGLEVFFLFPSRR
jgi:hypothetical protein